VRPPWFSHIAIRKKLSILSIIGLLGPGIVLCSHTMSSARHEQSLRDPTMRGMWKQAWQARKLALAWHSLWKPNGLSPLLRFVPKGSLNYHWTEVVPVPASSSLSPSELSSQCSRGASSFLLDLVTAIAEGFKRSQRRRTRDDGRATNPQKWQAWSRSSVTRCVAYLHLATCSRTCGRRVCVPIART
jgi:hypothetical protein